MSKFDFKLHKTSVALRQMLRRGALASGVFGLISLSTPALAGTIGYVVLDKPGNTSPAAAIIAAGHTPQALGTLTGANLAGVDVLWVLNPSNDGYAADYTSNLAAISSFVAGGGRLLFHDRTVAGAESVIPGAASVTFVRDPGEDIQTTTAAPGLLSAPGGTISDSNLDGGGYSNHGYALVATLPNGSVVTLTQGNPDHAVDFHYVQDGGAVYYSTIPLDYSLDNAHPSFSQIYAVNLAAYIFNLAGGAQAVSTPMQHAQLPMYWDAGRRIGNMRARLGNIRGAGRDRMIAQREPVLLAAAGPVTLGERADQNSGKGFFVEFANAESHQGTQRNLAGYDARTTSATVGYETALSRDFAVGVALGHDDTKTDSSRVRGKSNAELFSASIFGRKYLSDLAAANAKDIYVDGVIGVRGGDVNLSRSTAVRGSTDALQGYFSATLGADFVVNETFTVTPYVGTEYVHTKISGFKEKGAGALSYSNQKTAQWDALLGVRAARSFTLGSVTVLGSASVELHHAFEQRNADISAGLAGIAGTTSRIATHELPKSYATANVGMEFSTRRNIAGYVHFSGFSSDSGSANGYSVGGGVRVSF